MTKESDSRLRTRVEQQLRALREDDLLRTPAVTNPLPNGFCTRADRKLVHFGSNDYLGLSEHPAVTEAFRLAAEERVGSGASALIAGRSAWHDRLERDLAAFEDTESALLFPTGFAANLGTISAVAQSDDALFCDRDNHASLIDAARAAGAKMLVYRRDNLSRLETSLRNRRADFAEVFLVTDGVYSMDGTIADLPALAELAARYDCHLIVDEAHGTGVLGPHGRGACDLTGTEADVLLRIGTLSKAAGVLGGFVCGPKYLTDLIFNKARTQFFSTSLPPAVCAAAVSSLGVMQSDPRRRTRLRELTEYAHETSAALTQAPGSRGPAPIIPLPMPNPATALRVQQELSEAGFLIPAVRPPTVPAGTSRLRMSLTCLHQEEQIDAAMKCIAGALR